MKKLLHSWAWRAERAVDRLLTRKDARRIVEPYVGYATPEHLVARGRVLTALRRNKPMPDQSRWTNLKQMASLFVTREVAGVEVQAHGVRAVTDDEGYFSLYLPRGDRAGWVDIPVALTGRSGETPCPVLIAQPNADLAVISDIDDTMMETGAYSLARNLWTSFTGNALTRRVYPDGVAFMSQMSRDGHNPVYYVSSSPWNLHYFLDRIFRRSELPRGPVFLRDLGISKTAFLTGSHGDHKGASIDVLVAANPGLRVVLVGDTGQHDAFVYRDAIARHPGRVCAVVLREPGPGPDVASQAAMDEIRQSGILMVHGRDFSDFAPQVLAASRAG